MSFNVYDMRRSCRDIPSVGICCIPFEKQYLEQYRTCYNAAFRPMRSMTCLSVKAAATKDMENSF